MRGTPYYRDAVYEQFSRAEYERRFNGTSAPRTSVNVLPWRGGARLVLAF